ncbi:C40 family peptidase, partial [Bacteroides fragilis]|nr:C40 family peptidase [Bacteroides fragilis]
SWAYRQAGVEIPRTSQAQAAAGKQVSLDALQPGDIIVYYSGASHVYGANGPSAFDCSGLTSWAYRQAGVEIPRTSQAQAAAGKQVSLDALQPG